MTKRTLILILLLVLTAGVIRPAAAAAQASEIACTFTVPAGREASTAYLQDNDSRTRFTLTRGQSLSIAWEGAADSVLLQWYDEKQWYSRDCGATIRLFDQNGKRLSEKVYSKLSYRMFLPVEGASRMEIVCTGGRANMISLCEVKVCASGYEPANLSKKEPVDLMLILSGVSDEVDMLGGLLPLYAGEHGIKTAVVYLGRDDGYQVQEAFDALDAMELDVSPLFFQREDHLTPIVNRISTLWKETQLKKELIELLTAYRPKIVVTCDPEDENATARAQYTGKLVRSLILDHTSSRGFPVQKLYHPSASGSTVLDGTQQLASYGGRTAVDVAKEGYAHYRSEACFGTVIPECPRFTLAYTAVGEDESKNDLFEHIDRNELIAYQQPTPAPTPVPTPEDTADPIPASTPTIDPDDQYFRQEGDPAEVVIQDYDNGHWEYRSDILSIIIDRMITQENNKPYWRYVAHIRMRRVNSFRPLVSARNEIAQANEPPWRLARSYRAVLAITGDNVNNADISFKGVMIRNGILYFDMAGDNTLVIDDDMTMRIYRPREISGLDLLDSGVTATFSFGPILVENGQVNPDAGKHRVSKENPRCGIGMVEPGHFVAIVSDGRDYHRAYGYTLGQFAQAFVDEGVQIAYNMDGGNSAGMVFMGEHINWHSVSSQRTWADALAWGYSQLVPRVTDTVNHYGDGAKH